MTRNENTLFAGFSRVDITPPLGVPMAGHANADKRLTSEILDPLEINTVAVRCGDKTALLMSADLIYIKRAQSDPIRRLVSQETGIPYEAIFIACTHTHTGPGPAGYSDLDEKFPIIAQYHQMLTARFVDGAKLAIADLKPAKMGYGVAKAENISFIRRYHMKDGSIRTNPGYHNPEIVGPVSEADTRVNVLRFVREGGKEIAVANFGVHADMLRGVAKVSADYPRFVRETVEAVMPAHCVFFTGAQGDLNHADFKSVKPKDDPFVLANDEVDRGYNFTPYINAKHMGRAIAGALFQVYGDVQWVDVDTVAYGNLECVTPTNMPDPKDLPRAREIIALDKAGKTDQIIPGLTEMDKNMLTTVRAEAYRMLAFEHGPETLSLPVSAIRIGPAVFVGIPGEPFNNIGVGLKENSPFEITLPCCLTNGGEGYYPMRDSYDQGGYEARSSRFKAGVAENLISTGTELMKTLV